VYYYNTNVNVKGKNVKLSLFLSKGHTMNMYWDGGITPCILDLGTTKRWVVSFTPRPLSPVLVG